MVIPYFLATVFLLRVSQSQCYLRLNSQSETVSKCVNALEIAEFHNLSDSHSGLRHTLHSQQLLMCEITEKNVTGPSHSSGNDQERLEPSRTYEKGQQSGLRRNTGIWTQSRRKKGERYDGLGSCKGGRDRNRIQRDHKRNRSEKSTHLYWTRNGCKYQRTFLQLVSSFSFADRKLTLFSQTLPHISMPISTSNAKRYPKRCLYANTDWTQPQYYDTSKAITVGNKLYYLSRSVDGLFVSEFDTTTNTWKALPQYQWMTDADGWNLEKLYATIRVATIGSALYVFGRGVAGTYLSSYDTVNSVWTLHPSFDFLTDASGFTLAAYYKTVKMVACGTSLYVTARSSAGINIASFDTATSTWTLRPTANQFTDNTVWTQVKYYDTFRLVPYSTSLWLVVRSSSGLNLIDYSTTTHTWNSAILADSAFSDASSYGLSYFYETMEASVTNNRIYVSIRGSVSMQTRYFSVLSRTFGNAPSLSQFANTGWMWAKYYQTINFSVCGSYLYVSGRSGTAVVLFAFNTGTGTWATLSTIAKFTDAEGWDQVNAYRSLRLVCAGAYLCEVGRKLTTLELTVYSVATSAWSAQAGVVYPCFNTCKACSGSSEANCTDCNFFAHLSTSAPSACVCNAGFYESAADGQCYHCASTCEECSGPTTCLSCRVPAVLTSASECVCSAGYFLDSAFLCEKCYHACQACIGTLPTQCSECVPNALMTLPPVSSCECPSDFYFSETPVNECLPCAVACATCSGPSDNQCVTCQRNAELRRDGTCACAQTYFREASSNSCAKCNVTCLECVSTGANDCVKCYSQAFLLSAAPAMCGCNPGHFPVINASNCAPCPNLCITCSDSTECLACNPTAVLVGTLCECETGLVFSSENNRCIPCNSGCSMCDANACSECKRGWFLYEQQCVKNCPDTFTANGGSCVEEQLSASLAVSASNSLIVVFSHAIAKNLTETDIAISLVASENASAFQVTWNVSVLTAYSSFEIWLQFADTTPEGNNTVVLRFEHPTDIVDSRGRSISTPSLSISIFFRVKSILATPSAETQEGITATAVTTSTVAFVAVMSMLAGNPTMLFSLLNQLQLITYIPLMDIRLPEELTNTLLGLNTNNIVANPMQFVFASEQSEGQPSELEVRYGFDSSLFLLNSGFAIICGAATLASYFGAFLLSKLRFVPMLPHYLTRILPKYKWGVPIRLWIQMYLDIGINALLQILNIKDDNLSAGLIVNYVFSGLFLALFCATPLMIAGFVCCFHSEMLDRRDQDFNRKWGVFYMEFSANSGKGVLMHYILYTLRRCSYAFLLMLLPFFPSIQLISALCFSALVQLTQTCGHLLHYRAYESKIECLCAVVLELSTLAIFGLISLFLFLQDEAVRTRLGFASKVVIFFSISCNSLFSLMQTMEAAKNFVKKLLTKNSKVHPDNITVFPEAIPKRERKGSSYNLYPLSTSFDYQ